MIANGHLCNDLDGNFTFLSVRDSSVTDYLVHVLNKFDINLLQDFKILEFSIFFRPCSNTFHIFNKRYDK